MTTKESGGSGPINAAGTDHQNHFWQVPVVMADLASRGIAPTSQQMEAFRDYLELRTLQFERSDPSAALARSEYPGYLETHAAGRQVLVPFHLGRFFPSGDVLENVVDIAGRVALVPTNPICISGSTTFLDALTEIGDLDYCEYHSEELTGLSTILREKTVLEASDLALVEVKCADKYHHPWVGLEQEVNARLTGDVERSEAETIKLDFISESALGVLPTTSLILPVGDDPEAGNAKRSFSYQEAVLCPDHPPRTLLRPESMGSYLGWLIEDAKRWLGASDASSAKRGAKALKRLLSAALLLGEVDLVEEVVNGLRHPAIGAATVRARSDELNEMLQRLPKAASERFAREVATSLNGIELDGSELMIAMEQMIGLGQDVLEEIELLLDSSENAA